MVTRIVYAKRPRKLPCVLSREEVIRLFEAITNYSHRVILMTTYAGGLRISVNLSRITFSGGTGIPVAGIATTVEDSWRIRAS